MLFFNALSFVLIQKKQKIKPKTVRRPAIS